MNLEPRNFAVAGRWSGRKRVERLLTVEEVAAWLRISKRTVRQWVLDEYIPFLKIGALVRFAPSSVREWLGNRETVGRATRRLTVGLD